MLDGGWRTRDRRSGSLDGVRVRVRCPTMVSQWTVIQQSHPQNTSHILNPIHRQNPSRHKGEVSEDRACQTGS